MCCGGHPAVNGAAGQGVKSSLIPATFILAHFIHWTNSTTALRGAGIAFHVWVGFVLVFMLDDYAAEKRPLSLVAIKAGGQLAGLLITGAILGGWQ